MERKNTKFKEGKIHLSAEISSPSQANDKPMDGIKTEQKRIFEGGKTSWIIVDWRSISTIVRLYIPWNSTKAIKKDPKDFTD